MARIPLIEPEHASPAVRAEYERMQALGFPLLNVTKVLGNNVDFLAGLTRVINSLYGGGALSPRYRELAYLRASQINACHY